MLEVEVLARTIFGEARDQGLDGMEAVAYVVLNRLRVSERLGAYWWGNTIEEICLKPYQFSCWNYDDPNREKLLKVNDDSSTFLMAMEIAQDAIGGALIFDLTNGATHYYNPSVVQFSPDWSMGERPTAKIGNHVFFRPAEVPKIIDPLHIPVKIKSKKIRSIFSKGWRFFNIYRLFKK